MVLNKHLKLIGRRRQVDGALVDLVRWHNGHTNTLSVVCIGTHTHTHVECQLAQSIVFTHSFSVPFCSHTKLKCINVDHWFQHNSLFACQNRPSTRALESSWKLIVCLCFPFSLLRVCADLKSWRRACPFPFRFSRWPPFTGRPWPGCTCLSIRHPTFHWTMAKHQGKFLRGP